MRMSRGCPATGRMSHRFDKETHRCKCGRWQAGYAPKKEPTLPRDECQICERKQAVGSFGLVHHGYRRPGWGCIVGDCMGSGHRPFPAFDALEQYLVAVRAEISRLEERLQELPTLVEMTYTYKVGHDSPWSGKKAERRTVTVKKGDVRKAWIEGGQWLEIPAFESIVGWEETKVRGDLKGARDEEIRVVGRIAKAA